MPFSEVSPEGTQLDAPSDGNAVESTSPLFRSESSQDADEPSLRTGWRPWYTALKRVLPVYIAVHIGFLIITCLSVLFTLKDFAPTTLPLHTLWTVWERKDTEAFWRIAAHGYTDAWRTAYFPFYPLLIRAVAVLTQDIFAAGFIISNIAGLLMLVTLYRLVEKDFSKERADRAILYLSLFPSAFFLAAMYSEALFLCLVIVGFYNLRCGHWWIAGLCGLLAGLTRSVGILFAIPFLYEYLRQHKFHIRAIRFDILAIGLIPMSVIGFAFYCYYQFHDPLAFSHGQAVIWQRYLRFPWHGFKAALNFMMHSDILNFRFLRNLIEASSEVFIFTLIVLGFVGPWRFTRSQWSYGILATVFFLFLISFPVNNEFPLESTTRYMLAVFPAFITLAGIGKHRSVNLYYLLISGAVLFFLLMQFLTGHWIT